MKKSDKITHYQKNVQELSQDLSSTRKQLIEAKIKQSSGKLKDTSLIKKLKYQINLAMTLITQKQNDNQKQNKK